MFRVRIVELTGEVSSLKEEKRRGGRLDMISIVIKKEFNLLGLCSLSTFYYYGQGKECNVCVF